MNKLKARFHFRNTEVQAITDASATVKTAKSSGTDNISSYFLKLALPFIEDLLAFLFNKSKPNSKNKCIHPAFLLYIRTVVESLRFLKEIRLKSLTIDQYQSCLSFQGSLKN